MNIIYRIFKQDPNSRNSIIAVTSALGVVVNLLISIIKIFIGILASSIAIISEGVNNATDALTSVLTFVGSKLARKHPNKKHPFGYGRIEYLTGLIISVIIVVTGIEMLIESVKLIFNPTELNISYISLTIVLISAIIKFVLGNYTIKMGKKASSTALEAVGIDCRNDSFVSIVTIISALVFLIFNFSIDAYAGIFTSIIIIRSGFEVLMHTVSELIGRPGEKELANQIYKEIYKTKYIVNAADMMLHNYGPDSWSGSVNIEIEHDKTVGEVYQVIHELQLRIMHEYKVTMVFGIYAVDNHTPESKQLRQVVISFIQKHKHIKSFHAIYFEPNTNNIYCDFVVDYELKNWDELKIEFLKYMKQIYPNNEIKLTIETEFV